MTVIKQDLEIAAISEALSTHLSTLNFGSIPINLGFEMGEQIVPPLISLYFLPGGPEPFQMGSTVEKYYRRVLQIDMYMESRVRVSTLIDILMDYLDTIYILITDPLQNKAVIGSVTCQNSDSIYGQIMTPNFEKAKVIRWRGIARVTLDSHYPLG